MPFAVAPRFLVPLTLLLLCTSGWSQGAVQLPATDPHSTPEWLLVAPHLPDPLSASAPKLEMAGDVLRARRFPEDAITFYKASANRGGDLPRLLKKEGVVHLELQHGLLAHLCFQQALKLNKRDGEAWNNLGASDFMLGNVHSAVGEYKKALRTNNESAIFHSNLSLAYFEAHDARRGRLELARAFAIDPEILHHANSGGYNLQILGSTHYAEICFAMARVSAAQGDQASALSWLTKAADRGFDVRAALKGDSILEPYLQLDQIKVLLANEDQLHAKTITSKDKPPSLGQATASR